MFLSNEIVKECDYPKPDEHFLFLHLSLVWCDMIKLTVKKHLFMNSYSSNWDAKVYEQAPRSFCLFVSLGGGDFLLIFFIIILFECLHGVNIKPQVRWLNAIHNLVTKLFMPRNSAFYI